MKCRLCQSDSCSLFCSDKTRNYFRCNKCQLIFVPPDAFITAEKEKKRYALHDNTPDNDDYVQYLQNMAEELHRIPFTSPKVLDYGCGAEKVLTDILLSKGVDCTAYDPLYDITFKIENNIFDIVILCEVVEHLRDIRKEVAIIKTILKPQGYVLIRTELFGEGVDFVNWWYVQDPTHNNFFSLPSMHQFGELLGRKIFYSNDKNIFILK